MEEISRKEFDDFRQEVDERIRSLGDRIGDIDRKFDEKIKMLDSLFKSKDDWKSYVDKSHDILCDKLDTCKGMLADNMNEISKVRTFAYDKSLTLESLAKQVCDFKTKTESDFKCIFEYRDSNLTICKDVSTANLSLERISELLKSKDSEYNKSIRDLFETICSAKDDIQNLKVNIHANQAIFSKLEADISKLSKSNDVALECITKVNEDLLREIKAQKTELIGMIGSELEDIFIPDVSHFVRDADMGKLRHEIDLCNLDSKNAFEKASNVDMQTAINSKKIESLQLKLNQLELKHQ